MKGQVETEVCIKINCPFVDKKTGYCARALTLRRPKNEVCISNVSIKMDRRKR